MSQKLKILINGCSHTRAKIPDNPKADSWAKILSQALNCHVVNLAKDGKANLQIIEQTIRYILNFNDVTHVVLQLTEWRRLNFFLAEKSGSWSNGWDNQSGNGATQYVKIPHTTDKDLVVFRNLDTEKETRYPIGDKNLTESIVTTGSLVKALSALCEIKGISLHILNMHSIGSSRGDPVWNSIPEEQFIIQNRMRGLYGHLSHFYDTPDIYHYEAAAHEYIATVVMNHILYKQQLRVKKEDFIGFDENKIFAYE